MPYVASTMTSDVNYNLYSVKPNGPHVNLRSILVKGQAGVAQKERSGRLWTPEGTMNFVSDEDLEHLKKDGTFQTHLKNGAVKIIGAKTTIEKAAKDMSKDKAAGPLTPKDFEKGGRATIPDEMKPNGGRKLQ